MNLTLHNTSSKLLRLLIFLLFFSFINLSAQVTTANLTGFVIDNEGNGLIGATIAATHLPTGSVYGTTTNDDGGYIIPNLRIGGPYTVEARYVSYKTIKKEDVYLKLGEKKRVDFDLVEEGVTGQEVVITANKNEVINKDRTGARTDVGTEKLELLPTISRSTSDFYRLTPMADGNSFGGRNDQYNNFSLDGSIFNNPFGLDAATPGGQTSASPISLDAIEQVQVSAAPYDVTQAGFTGASVNAVTKSGSNTFHGTVFGYWRNQDLTGSKVAGTEIFVPELTQLQYGASLGGPIVKDKIFFFANFESDQREDLGSNFFATRDNNTVKETNISRVLASDLDLVSNILINQYGYDPGPYEGYLHETNSIKGLFKLDFNLSQNHRLTATYNFLDASKDKPAHPSALGRRGPDNITLQFQNAGYRINNIIHSGIIELNSIIGTKFSNKLQAGYTAFRDSRDPFSDPFPVLNINKDGNRYIVAGHEPFSIHNVLDQDVFQITNNFNIYSGKHAITIGASFERFDFNNSFNLGVNEPFGVPYAGGTFGPGFGSVQEFVDYANPNFVAEVIQNDTVVASYANPMQTVVDHAQSTFDANGGAEGEGWALAETNIGQLGIYVQDELSMSRNFTLTAGIRVDFPLYFNTSEKIEENLARNCCYDSSIEYFDKDGNSVFFDHTELPEATPLISPRLGFNWDVSGDRKKQLRGGTGFFTGRLPFVWIGNQVANPNSFFYTVTARDFKFPQVWRSNLGYDHNFGNDLIASVDLIYTKDINAMMVRNYGLKAPTATLSGVDNRPVYGVDDYNVAGNNAYVFTNDDQGYSFNATLDIKKTWGKNFYTGVAYNFLQAEDVSSIEAEISSDAYDRNPAFGNVNIGVLAPSLYGNRHRIIGNATKRFVYGSGKMATSIGIFVEAAQGGRFSYTYAGDINGDRSGLNDLIYIPTATELGQMLFSGDNPEAQRAALEAFIGQDEYLSANRGGYAEKYGILSPWFSNWDLRITQDLKVGTGAGANTIQLSFNVLNLGNLLNSEWGVRQLPSNTQPIGVGFDSAGTPVYSFDTSLTESFRNDISLLSRWQANVGLRYIF